MSTPGKLARSSRWKTGPSKGYRPPGSECCVAPGDSGREAYTAIAWGVGLSPERSDMAGAEGFHSLEGNMCGTDMRDADALPGSKATSRAKGSHRNLGYLVSGRRCRVVPSTRGQFVPSRRRRMMANVRAECLLKIPAEPSPELRYPRRCSSNASGLHVRNSARTGKSARAFKGIICDDISEFESHMPSQAVPSLWAMSRWQKFARHSRELWRRWPLLPL